MFVNNEFIKNMDHIRCTVFDMYDDEEIEAYFYGTCGDNIPYNIVRFNLEGEYVLLHKNRYIIKFPDKITILEDWVKNLYE